MTTAEADLVALEHEGDLASFCPHCHAGLDVYDARTKRVWIGLSRAGRRTRPASCSSTRVSTSFEHACSRVAGATGRSPTTSAARTASASLRRGGARLRATARRRSSASRSRCARAWPRCRSARAPAATGTACPPRPQAKIQSAAPRQKKPEQDAVLRVRNFAEVSYGYDGELAVAEAGALPAVQEAGLRRRLPRRASTSPASSALIAEGEFAPAAQLIRRRNALPAICGRVCPQDEQCEKVCLLGKKGEPLAIGALERFAADFERETDQVKLPRRAPRTGRRVAVVGSGPAGLTLAADLGVLGPQRHDLRGPAQGRRRARVRHPRVPPAQEHRGGRDRQPAPSRRQVRAQQHRRQALRSRRALRARLRRRLRRHRRRAARLHGPARREPLQRRLRQRVPHARQPHEGLSVPRVRHAGAQGHARGGGGRRQRGHGLRPHGAAHGRARGDRSSTGARARRCRRARRRSSTPSRRACVPLPRQSRALHRRRAALGAADAVRAHEDGRARRERPPAAHPHHRLAPSCSTSTW